MLFEIAIWNLLYREKERIEVAEGRPLMSDRLEEMDPEEIEELLSQKTTLRSLKDAFLDGWRQEGRR